MFQRVGIYIYYILLLRSISTRSRCLLSKYMNTSLIIAFTNFWPYPDFWLSKNFPNFPEPIQIIIIHPYLGKRGMVKFIRVESTNYNTGLDTVIRPWIPRHMKHINPKKHPSEIHSYPFSKNIG